VSLKKALRNARRRLGETPPTVQRVSKGTSTVTLPEMTVDRTEEFVAQAVAARPTAGIDAQLAKAMELSRGSIHPKRARELIRRLRNG